MPQVEGQRKVCSNANLSVCGKFCSAKRILWPARVFAGDRVPNTVIVVENILYFLRQAARPGPSIQS